MKKLLLILLVLFTLSAGAYWWSIIEVQRGTASVQVDDARLRVWYNFVLPTYADTTAANMNLGLDYIGAAIHTTTPAAIYFRDTTTAGHKWSILASTPASPIWGLITGTLSSQTDLQTALNAKQNLISLGTTAQYFRGDLSLATFPTDLSSFTNGPGYLTSVNVSMSVAGDGSSGTPLKLVNDNASPGANKYYGTDNGGTKGWQAVTSNSNIYNSNGDINDDRYLGGPIALGAATKSLFFDSLLNFNINSSGLGNGFTVFGSGTSSLLQVAGNDIDETAISVSSNISSNRMLGDSNIYSSYNASDTGKITVSTGYINFYQFNGIYRIRNLLQANDTSLWKPVVANSTGQIKRMDGWAGSGGGGGVAVDAVQSYSSGTTLTQTTGDNIIQLNPASVQSTLTITTATSANWHNSNDLYIVAGGTVTSGNPVITTLAVAAGSGLTLVQAVTPTTINAGEVIRYKKIGTLIYRIN